MAQIKRVFVAPEGKVKEKGIFILHLENKAELASSAYY